MTGLPPGWMATFSGPSSRPMRGADVGGERLAQFGMPALGQ